MDLLYVHRPAGVLFVPTSQPITRARCHVVGQHDPCQTIRMSDFCLLDSEQAQAAERELQGFAQLPSHEILGASEAFIKAHPAQHSTAVVWINQDEAASCALATTTALRYALLAHQPFFTGDRLCVQEDGTPFWQHCHAMPTKEGGGEYVTFSVDVTQAHEYVGDYTLGTEIGKGAHGSVRLGVHKDTGARVAIKRIDMNIHAGMTRVVENEIAIQQRLDSKYIARLLETVHKMGVVYLVMELVSQGSLYERVKQQGGVSEEQAFDLFFQLAEAVSWCHQQGVCHRDLKLENIVLDGDGMPKLIDFGLSTFYVSGQKFNGICGSRLCQAPEMASAFGGYHPEAADVWALGVVLFELLHGSITPPASRSGLTAAQHISNHTAMLNDDEASSDILRRMLDPNPATRICISEMFDHPWSLHFETWWCNEKSIA